MDVYFFGGLAFIIFKQWLNRTRMFTRETKIVIFVVSIFVFGGAISIGSLIQEFGWDFLPSAHIITGIND